MRRDWQDLTSHNVHNLIATLEAGVIRQDCNPRGNFANICRAIVIKTRGLPDWNFDHSFLTFLGLQARVTPIRIVSSAPSLFNCKPLPEDSSDIVLPQNYISNL